MNIIINTCAITVCDDGDSIRAFDVTNVNAFNLC